MVTTALSFWIQSRRSNDARREVMDTSVALWKQGFKTHFADFDFKTDDATRARMATLTFLDDLLQFGQNREQPNLLLCSSNSAAIVIWKQEWLTGVSDVFNWSELHAVLNTNRDGLDAACAAAIAGPIRFEPNVAARDDVWGDHLSGLRYLMAAVSARAIVEMHDGHWDDAWTNLFAATRLVTAWQPEPTEQACFARADFAKIVFADIWQALQGAKWTDARLAALQQEWESANFLTNLPEIAAFQRVSEVSACQKLGNERQGGEFSFFDVAKEAIDYPAGALSDIRQQLAFMHYQGREQLKDEKNLLLYFRDRELEFRHAIQSPTWADMWRQSGVAIAPPMQCWYEPMVEDSAYVVDLEPRLAACMADAEARRRVLITAIALERHRLKYGTYPATLTTLAPGFLKVVPLDFADGKPLRYRLSGDGYFVLYSVGLDCADNGGQMTAPIPADVQSVPPPVPDGDVKYFNISTNEDIVWPCPNITSTGK